MIKAILMDFNGVIIDDEAIQMRVYQDVLGARGVELTEEDYYASLGMDDWTFVRAAYERKGKTADDATCDDVVAEKDGKWLELVADKLPLFEGVEGFVKKAAQDFSLGIVSMAPRQEIEYALDRSGLAKYFSTIVAARDVTACKPDPQCYRLGFRDLDAARTAAGHLPMTHDECLVIEDSPPGVVAARRADLQALGVTNTVTADRLCEAGARAVATDLRDWMPETIRLVFSN